MLEVPNYCLHENPFTQNWACKINGNFPHSTWIYFVLYLKIDNISRVYIKWIIKLYSLFMQVKLSWNCVFSEFFFCYCLLYDGQLHTLKAWRLTKAATSLLLLRDASQYYIRQNKVDKYLLPDLTGLNYFVLAI